eukprot:5417796-Amphidinium_carterae.1
MLPHLRSRGRVTSWLRCWMVLPRLVRDVTPLDAKDPSTSYRHNLQGIAEGLNQSGNICPLRNDFRTI